ncbi:hypothetical protein [Capnocytophaga felis]|uniref:hypothetical protein n=1 Tax=Capnocytophaga felis TaxID=2267611 RepID=UPI0012D32C5E|nr:hypothetical protein [Capnocytophaga felis]
MIKVPIVRLSEVEALLLQGFDFAQPDKDTFFLKVSYFCVTSVYFTLDGAYFTLNRILFISPKFFFKCLLLY